MSSSLWSRSSFRSYSSRKTCLFLDSSSTSVSLTIVYSFPTSCVLSRLSLSRTCIFSTLWSISLFIVSISSLSVLSAPTRVAERSIERFLSAFSISISFWRSWFSCFYLFRSIYRLVFSLLTSGSINRSSSYNLEFSRDLWSRIFTISCCSDWTRTSSFSTTWNLFNSEELSIMSVYTLSYFFLSLYSVGS